MEEDTQRQLHPHIHAHACVYSITHANIHIKTGTGCSIVDTEPACPTACILRSWRQENEEFGVILSTRAV